MTPPADPRADPAAALQALAWQIEPKYLPPMSPDWKPVNPRIFVENLSAEND